MSEFFNAIEANREAQRIASQLGRHQMANEVIRWAERNSPHIGLPAFAELMKLLTKDIGGPVKPPEVPKEKL